LFQFRKISSQEIFDALKMILEKEKIKFDVDALMEISKLGDGSMRDAESLLDQILAFSGDYLKIQDVRDVLGITPNSLFFELTDHIFCLRKKEAFDIIESIINQGYDLGLFIKDYVQFFRDLLIKKSISNNLSEEYIKLCKNISSNKIIQIIELLLNLLNEMKFSSYTSILLEMSIFKIFQMIESLNYDDLSNHLKKIELLFEKGSFSNNSKEENSLQNPVKKKTVDRLEELNIIKSSINDFSETLNVPLSEYLKKVSIKSVDNDKLQLEGKKIYIERLIEAGIDKKFSVFLEKQIGLKLKINFLFFEKSEKTENKFDDVTELPLVKKTLEFFDGKLIDVVKK
jgi:DNA polymerase-3 subunit gamma/tau